MYFGTRYYDPTIGRFITRDPVKGTIMNPQSLNPYVYCLNNPLKYVDPDGRENINYLYEYYCGDPLLRPIRIDTSSWEATLWTIQRVQHRIYKLHAKISEINLSERYKDEFEHIKKQFEYWQEKTHEDINFNNWPDWQQDVFYAGIPGGFEGFLWAFGVYMFKFDINISRTDYYLRKLNDLQKYKEEYVDLYFELSELLLELIEILEDQSGRNYKPNISSFRQAE
jgi:hypothetical protein